MLLNLLWMSMAGTAAIGAGQAVGWPLLQAVGVAMQAPIYLACGAAAAKWALDALRGAAS